MVNIDIIEPIDAVITWVNGGNDTHRIKRQHYIELLDKPLHENAVNPHRWICNDEILYCLKSIENHAPWTRKIWIVVDNITPDLSSLSDFLKSKIHIAYHHEIFVGFEEMLPTFNSIAIESMLWRIKGLAERFMYFNDDVFLTAPLAQQDVFVGQKTVLRGEWADYSHLEHDSAQQENPAKFNHYMQINAARVMGFSASRLFNAAHVVHPFLRSRMEQLFTNHQKAFLANISYRFRDLRQFLPQGLHNHASICNAQAVFHKVNDYLHIHSGQGNGRPSEEIWSLLYPVTKTTDIKMLCINDLPQLIALIPDVDTWLSQAIGDF
jgi:hypothetical protein